MAFYTNWLKYFTPTEKAPKSPQSAEKSDQFLDYTFSVLGTISNSMTPQDLAGILQQAADGYSSDQARLIKEIQEKEPVIAAHLATRKLSITSKGWNITSVDHPEIADELELMLKSAELSSIISHLADYIITGYSMAVIDWAEGGRAINGFVPVAPEAIEYDLAGNRALIQTNGMKTPVANFHPNQFLYCASNSKPGIPARNGLGRVLVWMYLFKHSGIAGYARYVEKFGIPFMLATLPQSQWAQRNTVLNSLKLMGRDGIGAIPEGTKLESLTSANSGSTEAQEKFIRYCDEIITVTILGQLASSAKASGFSSGQAQENVRQDLLASDCQTIISTVQKQIIEPIIEMKYGLKNTDVQFYIDFEQPEDLTEKAKQWLILTQITGKPIDASMVEEEFGVKFSKEAVEKPVETEVETEVKDDIAEVNKEESAEEEDNE